VYKRVLASAPSSSGATPVRIFELLLLLAGPQTKSENPVRPVRGVSQCAEEAWAQQIDPHEFQFKRSPFRASMAGFQTRSGAAAAFRIFIDASSALIANERNDPREILSSWIAPH